jgi:hypothetical protein
MGAKHTEGARGISESASNFLRSLALDEVGAERLVLALTRRARLKKEGSGIC